MKFHVNALKHKYKDSVLHHHVLEHHPGHTLDEDDFIFRVTGRDSRPLVRQCREGVALSNILDAMKQGDKVNLMNSKSEFMQPGVVHRTFSRILAADKGPVDFGLGSQQRKF